MTAYLPPGAIRIIYGILGIGIAVLILSMMCSVASAGRCSTNRIVHQQAQLIQVPVVPQVFYFIGGSVPNYTTQPQQLSESEALFREFLEWKEGRGRQSQTLENGIIAQKCANCHIENEEAKAALSFDGPLSPKDITRAIRAVRDGRMPKGLSLTGTEASEIYSALLDMEEQENEEHDSNSGTLPEPNSGLQPSGNGPS